MFSRQRCSNSKNGLGFSNFPKPSTSNKIFVKASTTSNDVEPKKIRIVNPSKISNVRNNLYGRNYSNFRNNSNSRNYSNFKNNSYNRNYSNNSHAYHIQNPNCFYCNKRGHTPNYCYIRKYSVRYGEYVWVMKISNQQGLKAHKVPCNTLVFYLLKLFDLLRFLCIYLIIG